MSASSTPCLQRANGQLPACLHERVLFLVCWSRQPSLDLVLRVGALPPDSMWPGHIVREGPERQRLQQRQPGIPEGALFQQFLGLLDEEFPARLVRLRA